MSPESKREDCYCLLCGDDNPIGFKLEFQLDSIRKTASAELEVPREFQGWRGIVHGGVITALLDEAAIYSCRNVGHYFVTTAASVSFLRPVHCQTDISLWAGITSQEGKVIKVRAELKVAEIVHARADFVIRELSARQMARLAP